MSEVIIKLKTLDGGMEEVKGDTRITLATFRKYQEEGLISKRFLNNLLVASNNPADADLSDMYNAAYMAYLNANSNPISRDEFEARIYFDTQEAAQLYSEIISGQAKKEQLINDFQKATPTKKNKSKKKYQHRT